MIFFGIDISKLTFDVTIVSDSKYKHKIFNNNQNGFIKFVKWMKPTKDECYICMEASGIYGMCLAQYLISKEYKVIVSNPLIIKRYSQQKMSRNKTDKADSLCIAKFARSLYREDEIDNSLYVPKSKNYQSLQELVTRLEQVNLLINQEVNHKESTLNLTISRFIQENIQVLKDQVLTIRTEITSCIDKDKNLKAQHQLLVSIPGIGDKTAWAILAYLGDISLFSNSSQVASYAGINPFIEESGTSVKSVHLSKMGSKRLRKALYMPAMVAMIRNPVLSKFYNKLVNKGKPKKVAICAVMRKLLVISYGVLKSEVEFDPNYKRCKAN